jgi:hypothetical protein
MTVFRTHRLAVPLVTPSGLMMAVTIRRVRLDDLVEIERRSPGPMTSYAKAAVLIEVLTDVPEGWARRLDMADFTDLAEGIADAMDSFPRTAPARGKPRWKG